MRDRSFTDDRGPDLRNECDVHAGYRDDEADGRPDQQSDDRRGRIDGWRSAAGTSDEQLGYHDPKRQSRVGPNCGRYDDPIADARAFQGYGGHSRRRSDSLRSGVIIAAHLTFFVLATAMVWRALAQTWVDDMTTDVIARAVVRWGILFATAAGSALIVIAGRMAGTSRRALAADAISFGLLLGLLFALSLGPLAGEVICRYFVGAVIVRFAPALLV